MLRMTAECNHKLTLSTDLELEKKKILWE